MSFVNTFEPAQPTPGASRVPMSRGQRKPIDDCGAGNQRHGPRNDWAAEFLASGGVATSSEVAERLREKISQPVSLLARWIVDRRVVVLSCAAGTALPLFQFDFTLGCLRCGVAPVVAVLSEAMTDDQVARWFVAPNVRLNGAVPADTCQFSDPAVLAAARADGRAARV